MVVDGLAPGGGGLTGDDREEAFTLHLGGDGDVGGGEDGGGVVDVHDHGGGDLAGLDETGVADEEGDTEGGIVHEAFVVPAVFAEVEAVVRGVDDECVGGLAGLIELIQDAAEAFVDADDVSVHIFDEALVDPVLALGGGEGFGEVGVVGGETEIESHVFGFAGDGAGSEVVVEVGGEGEIGFREEVSVSGGGGEGAMGAFGLVDEAEGPGVGLGEELEGHVGGDVGDVAGVLFALSVLDEFGIAIDALAGEDAPGIEAAGVVAEVPLADDAGAVAGFLEEFGVSWDGGVHGFYGVFPFGVSEDLVDVGEGSSEAGGAGGGAEGVCDEGVCEADALAGEAVHVGRFKEFVAVAAHEGDGLVVGHDEEDVGAGGGGGEELAAGGHKDYGVIGGRVTVEVDDDTQTWCAGTFVFVVRGVLLEAYADESVQLFGQSGFGLFGLSSVAVSGDGVAAFAVSVMGSEPLDWAAVSGSSDGGGVSGELVAGGVSVSRGEAECERGALVLRVDSFSSGVILLLFVPGLEAEPDGIGVRRGGVFVRRVSGLYGLAADFEWSVVAAASVFVFVSGIAGGKGLIQRGDVGGFVGGCLAEWSS